MQRYLVSTIVGRCCHLRCCWLPVAAYAQGGSSVAAGWLQSPKWLVCFCRGLHGRGFVAALHVVGHALARRVGVPVGKASLLVHLETPRVPYYLHEVHVAAAGVAVKLAGTVTATPKL